MNKVSFAHLYGNAGGMLQKHSRLFLFGLLHAYT